MGESQIKFDQLCEFVTGVMAKAKVPGVAVGLLHRDETYTAGLGVTNVDHPLPVTDETLFQIGSITKTFTGLAMLRLVEMGKLDLDATVRAYLPDFRVADEIASSQATLRHLLTHTSGWEGDVFEDTGAGDDALPKYVAVMAGLEQLAPLGTVWSYNNAGFYLAGHIIERVTGQSYQVALGELVLEPLGLENCYLNPGDVMTHRFAVGHEVGEEGATVDRPWPLPRAAWSAGGIVCHVRDLLRYARFQLGDGAMEEGTRLLDPGSMARMHAPQVTIWGQEHRMGLSWFVDEVGGTRTLSHGGRTVGQVSLLTLMPEYQLAIVTLTNADEGGKVTDEVRRWVLEHVLGVQDPKPEPIESSIEDMSPFVGRYVRPFAEIELGTLGGRLVGQVTYKKGFPSQDVPPRPPPPPMALALCEKDRLLVTDGPSKDARLDVIREPGGEIGWLRFLRRIHRRVE